MNRETGLYFIDDDFIIKYFNPAVKEMYPDIETGQHCYKALGCREDRCPHCPLNDMGSQNSFYNSRRNEWIHAHGAEAELPNIGRCYAVTFTAVPDSEHIPDASAETSENVRMIEELEAQNKILQQHYRLMEFLNDGMPGGYHRCSAEDGFPFLYVSEKLLNILGFTREELRVNFDDKLINLIHPLDRELYSEAIESVISPTEKREVCVHYRIITDDGYINVVDTTRMTEYDGKSFLQGVIVEIGETDVSDADTEMDAAQSALHSALIREQQYRHKLDTMQTEILDTISCGVLAYTLPDYRLLIANAAAKRIIGCDDFTSPLQGLKVFLQKYVYPEDRKRVDSAKDKLKKHGDIVIQDYRAIINGALTYVHSIIKYLIDENGKPYIMVTMLDTTEQESLTKNLVRERRAFRNALSNGSEFNFIFDVTKGLLYEEFVTAQGVNIVRKLGFNLPANADELLDKYIKFSGLEFIGDEALKTVSCKYLLDCYNSGKTSLFTEYYNPHNDTYMRLNILMYLDDETGHVHATVVAYNVTELRRKEHAKQEDMKRAFDEMNIRIDAVLNGISGGLKVIDLDGGPHYSYVSEGAAQLQGYTPEEFLNKFSGSINDYVYLEDKDTALEEAFRQVKSKGVYNLKYRILHRDGSVKWVIDRGKIATDSMGKKHVYVLMQDITELEDRNAEIVNVLAMQKEMADSLGGGIFAYTLPDRKIILLNREAKRMFGYKDPDPQNFGRVLMEMIIPEDLPTVRESSKRLQEAGGEVEYVFRTPSDNSGVKTYKSNTKLLSFEDGQKYILSALTDITDQEFVRKRLDEERRQYRNALIYGSLCFFNIDITDGRIFNPIVAQDGVNFADRLSVHLPSDYNTFAAALFDPNRIISDSKDIEAARTRESLIKACEDGRTILEIEYSVPETRKYYRLVILLYMINNRCNAGITLFDTTESRHEEKQKRSIIESLGKIYSALYHVSLTENTFHAIKILDDLSSELPENCTYDELISVYTGKYIEPEFKDSVTRFLDPNSIRRNLSASDYADIEFKRTGLGWFRLTVVAAERDAKGTVSSIVMASNLIESQKQAELSQRDALRAAYESANIANSAKTNFLANMSHDIRTPMNAIIGMTAIASTHIDDKERVADCLSKINISSKHLLGLINEVLDMSKIESGKMELLESEFNLPDLIDNLLMMSKQGVTAKNHDLKVIIHNIEHEDVIGDSQRIQQVFMNLMGNAVKYTPEGGKLSLTVSERPTNQKRIGCYEFIFEDNGIGMSEEFIKHIFEPFSRATGDSRVGSIQGTGLGMPITKSIVQMMNGDVKVESQLNKGTKITVLIFLKLKEKEQDIRINELAGKTVLVADDDEIFCIYTCQLLSEMGMESEWVLSGKEALEKITERHEKNEDYFAVILDWRMPETDGIETAKIIRRTFGKELPVIFTSSHDLSDIELEARNAGVNAFISKPIFRSRLAHLFSDLLSGDSEKKNSSELDAISEENFSGKRALLVEDNSLNAEIAGEILGMTGLVIEYAKNGKEAVDIMSNVPDGYFDIVFMDIQMPIMNGYEAARAIRALPRTYTKSVPILAMTANAFAEDVSAAKNAGMNEHIAKPLDFNRVDAALRHWLG